MEIRQLRYFVALAEELSFTRAADKLHLSQPPLSFQIANLETELGALLFNRSSRRVALSDAGKALLPHACAVIERIQEARLHVQRIATGVEGRVHVGLSGSHFHGPFPQFMKAMRVERPRLEIVLNEMRPADHIEALRDRRLDVSLSRATINDAQIESRLLWRDPVVAALPAGHRLAGRKRIALAALRDEDFVFLPLDSSPYARRVFQACVALGVTPRITHQVNELPAAVNLVGVGLGVSLIPLSMAQGIARNAVVTCQVNKLAVEGDVHALIRKTENSSAVLAFLQSLGAWAAARQPGLAHG
jgi:LysR family transcriptional regulator, benzoate and cis,cis-muconate-responsive activator of ben and cat genes